MTSKQRVAIEVLTTGVPGLDEVLGGGVPEFSFNLIAGEPGTGKTTLGQQIAFNLATRDRPAVYFTVVGESTLKMLRYQQQYAFFDFDKLDAAVRFVNLGQEVFEGDMQRVLERILGEVESSEPHLVMVDSFRAVLNAARRYERELPTRGFLQSLSLHLASWQVTSFLIGEYEREDVRHDPIFTVADGILWLEQAVNRNSMVRKLQVVKMRGQAPMPGLHTFRLTRDGVQIFPRITDRIPRASVEREARRLSTGVAGLDAMLAGGIPASDSVLVTGPSGSGKTILASHFLAAGLAEKEPVVLAMFEEHPERFSRRYEIVGVDFEKARRDGALHVVHLRPLDLSMDETLHELRETARRTGARRMVLDSLSGLEIALAPTFRHDFRESLYRMIAALTGMGITLLMTAESSLALEPSRLTSGLISILTDHVVTQRCVQIGGQLRRTMAVVKMRGSNHDRHIRHYEIGPSGIEVTEPFRGHVDAMAGTVEPSPGVDTPRPPGLDGTEALVLETVRRLGGASVQSVGECTGLRLPAVRRALSRLTQLGYAHTDRGEWQVTRAGSPR